MTRAAPHHETAETALESSCAQYSQIRLRQLRTAYPGLPRGPRSGRHPGLPSQQSEMGRVASQQAHIPSTSEKCQQLFRLTPGCTSSLSSFNCSGYQSKRVRATRPERGYRKNGRRWRCSQEEAPTSIVQSSPVQSQRAREPNLRRRGTQSGSLLKAATSWRASKKFPCLWNKLTIRLTWCGGVEPGASSSLKGYSWTSA